MLPALSRLFSETTTSPPSCWPLGLAWVTVSKPRFWRSSRAGTRKSSCLNGAFMSSGSILNWATRWLRSKPTVAMPSLTARPSASTSHFLSIGRPAASTICCMRKFWMPDGRLSASWTTVPKNQKPVSATPTKSLPAFRKRKADSAPKSRDGEVISSPPTNSSGPNCLSARPIWNSVIGRAEISIGSTERRAGRDRLAPKPQPASRRDGGEKRLPKAAARKDHPARRMPPRRVSRALSSPNSEASCSVMAPASSSASTMVTARR